MPAFYSREELVVELEGKSQTVAEEIEERFACIGGSDAEWIRYLSRPDLPANMWRWGLADEVKAITGVSATPKKDGVRQRRLLMQCSANNWFSDPASRGELGLHGREALSRVHVPAGTWEVAICERFRSCHSSSVDARLVCSSAGTSYLCLARLAARFLLHNLSPTT